jgi:hypothetical protein
MGWFSRTFYGVDLDEEQARQDDLDRRLREMNERDYGRGGRLYERISAERGEAAADETYQDVLDNLESSRIDDVEAQVRDAFYEGLQDGTRNIQRGFDFSFGAIPWQLWAAGAVALFLWAGGGAWLKGVFKK